MKMCNEEALILDGCPMLLILVGLSHGRVLDELRHQQIVWASLRLGGRRLRMGGNIYWPIVYCGEIMIFEVSVRRLYS